MKLNSKTTACLLAALALLATAGLASPALAQDTAAAAAADAAPAKQTPPPGGEPKGFDLPSPKTFSLDNGLSATMVQYGVLPKVSVSARVRTGNADETAEELWLADLTTNLMQEGTTSRDAQTLAAEAASMGGSLNVGVGADTTSAGANVLSEFGPDAVRLIADLLRNPAFPESELDRLKADMVRNITISLSQPQPVAQQKLDALIYGDHPYGRTFPTPEQVQGYTADDVRRFYGEHFGAGRTHVYVVGRFDEAAVEAAIRESFGDWAAGPEAGTPAPTLSSARKVHLVDRPGAAQSTVRIAIPVIDRAHPDFIALEVTNSLLGGSFSSRITSNIREDKGYTYSPGTGITTRVGTGVWTQFADITTNVTGAAIKEIFYEIDRLRGEAPSQEELDGVLNYMAGIFVLQNSTPGGITGLLARQELHGLPDDYLSSYVDNLYAVTPERVREIADKYLRSGEMTIVIVGDRAQVASQVTEFGEVVD